MNSTKFVGAAIGSNQSCESCKKMFVISNNEERIMKTCSECTERLESVMRAYDEKYPVSTPHSTPHSETEVFCFISHDVIVVVVVTLY